MSKTLTDPKKQLILRRVLGILASVFACIVLLGGAAGAVYLIYQTEPAAQREGATRKTAALVETVTVTRGTHRPELVVLGNVQPARTIMLSALVSGEIIEVDPAFMPGVIVDKGQPLIRIDPADFENVLVLRMSELKQVEAELAIEQGRQAVARKELEALDRSVSEENRPLVLREPQIAAIRARVDAARAEVNQAELDLKRTQVNAPFDAQIIRRQANLGSQVGAGQAVAEMVGVEEYWVVASVPLRHLERIGFAEKQQGGSGVSLTMKSAWPAGTARQGEVTRLIGGLDPESRLAQVLITIKDPLSRESDAPPLLLDTIVEARIAGKPLEGVVQISRDYLRQGDAVWVLKDGKLEIRKVTIAFSDAGSVYISEGLESGDQVVTTSLSAVTPGQPLRRVGDAEQDEPAAGGAE